MGADKSANPGRASASAWVLAAAAALAVTGCAGLAKPPARAKAAEEPAPVFLGSRTMREQRLIQQWAGRPRDELLKAWGTPTIVLKSPGFNEHRDALIFVFANRDPVGGCIDAFVIWGAASGDSVSTYYCR